MTFQIAKYATNTGIAGIAHRRASGFVEIFTLRADRRLIWLRGDLAHRPAEFYGRYLVRKSQIVIVRIID